MLLLLHWSQYLGDEVHQVVRHFHEVRLVPLQVQTRGWLPRRGRLWNSQLLVHDGAVPLPAQVFAEPDLRLLRLEIQEESGEVP